MTLAEAIDIVARQILSTGDVPIWEDYPEIGEDDWDRVLARMDTLTPAPNTAALNDAYDLLTARGSDKR